MAVIAQHVFGGVTYPYITLENEEIVRPLAIGTNWNSLRIVVQCAARVVGTSDILNTSLIVGVCSGVGATWGSPTTTNFAGMTFTGNGATYYTWTYVANSGNPTLSFANMSGIKKVGSVITLSAAQATNTYVPVADQGLARRGLLAFTLTKGATNYTMTPHVVASGSSAIDLTLANAVEVCESGALNGVVMGGGVGLTLAVSEATGRFDTLSVYWPRTGANLIEIYSIFVARLA